ncbi:MAG TPA: hypothetical protein VGN01_17490 [Acidobacteriaceae bacterium]
MNTRDLIDILLNTLYSFTWFFAGMYLKDHPESVARFACIGHQPPGRVTKGVRITGLVLATIGFAAVVLALGFFGLLLFERIST